jgi:hypothetical protein
MTQYVGMIELERSSLLLAAASLAALFLVFVFGGIPMWIIKRRLRKKYKLIYRVISVPSDHQFMLKAVGASIEIGDYGWEAEPIYKDGLIYLHGLNPRWQVVWYAGFRPDQVEVVGPKPRSQYYSINPYANVDKIPQCPFPVQKYEFGKYPDFHLGFAEKIGREWVQGRQIRTGT